MKIKYSKAYRAIRFQDKLPRKVKKHLLGNLISKKELKEKLSKISKSNKCATQMLIDSEIESLFCPKCGCNESYTVNYACEYPEVWNESFCARCGTLIEMQDNSPCHHVLDAEDFRFD